MLNPDDRWAADSRLPVKRTSDSDSESSSIDDTKPKGRPKSDKPFRKLLDDKEDDSEELKDIALKKKAGAMTGMVIEEEAQVFDSPMALYQQSTLKKKTGQDVAAHGADIHVPKKFDNDTPATDYLQTSPDLSAVNPNAYVNPSAIGASEVTPSVPNKEVSSSRLQDIMTQILDRIYTLKKTGETDTVMILKFPPIFAGASLTVTAFDTARGEFNVTFSNLTPVAKELLDMQQAQNSLQRALEEKGYTIHILITTTEADKPIAAKEADKNNKEGQGDRQQQQQQQQQQQEE